MSEEKKYFTKLPSLALYTEDKKEKSILECLDYEYKSILVLEHLIKSLSLSDGLSRFSIENIIESCGYKPDNHKGRTNDIFKGILSNFEKLGIIKSSFDLSSIKPKEYLEVGLNIDLDDRFVIVLPEEKEKLKTVNGIDYAQIFTYYYYIKSRVYKRSKEDGLAVANGGRYESCFVSFRKIHDDLKITDKTIVKYNNILTELNLIRYKNFGTYYYSYDSYKTVQLSPNFYTLFNGDEEEASRNLQEGFDWFECQDINKDKVFTMTGLTVDNRSVGGKLGALNKKEKKGKITEEELIEKKKLEDYISDSNSDNHRIVSDFNNVEEGKLLSDYYYDSDLGHLYETTNNLEVKLGLVDVETNELLVDYGYYKWVLTNYSEEKLEYYKNCVKKRKKKNKISNVWGAANPMDSYSDDEFCELLS